LGRFILGLWLGKEIQDVLLGKFKILKLHKCTLN